MRSRTLVVLVGCLLLLVAPTVSLGMADSDAGKTSQRTALKSAVRAYSAAFLGGKAKTAWLMRTAHANAGLTYAEFRAICLQAHEIYGDATMTSLSVDSLKGSKARVSYGYDINEIDQSRQPWRLVSGHWKYDYQSAKSSARGAKQATTYVYVTDTGTKYHRKTCQTLQHSKHRITLTKAKKAGYKPCKVCKPPR
jgi:hypothetical protein